MKKLSYLTLAGLLAACAGGGGGGSGGGGGLPERAAISDAAIASNEAITKMVSEIGKSSGGTIVNSGRAATGTFNHNGTIYTTYRLDDVDFKTLITSGAADKLKFLVDADGRINGIQFENVSHSDGSSANMFKPMERQGETATFEMASSDLNGTFEYKSYATLLGLQYSDFGVVRVNAIDRGNTITDYDIPFVGGYAAAKADKFNMPAGTTTTFTGTAAGMVMDKDMNGALALNDTNATLKFNRATGGTETLSASFSNWYDIEVVRPANGPITFNIDGTGKTIASQYQINPPNPVLNNGQFNNNEVALFDVNYYGLNNTAEEATALFQYQAPDSNPAGNVNVMIGFGGTRQP